MRPGPFAAIVAAMTLALGVVAPALAQADDEAIPYLDAQGNQLGTILIRGFVDPFTGYDPTAPPAEGQRYAMLTLTFEAAEDKVFPTDPYQVQLLDSNGFLYYPDWVPRPADDPVPDLQSQDLAPFDRVSGAIPYILPDDAEVVRILYRGDGQRLLTLAQMGEADGVALGEPREIKDLEGTTFGSATLRQVVDPFLDFDAFSPPPAGQRYVALEMAFEAAEDQSLWAYPGSVLLVGTDGQMYWPTWVPRVQPVLLQDLQTTPLSPSDRISGILSYTIPDDAQIVSVVYNADGSRLLPIADL